MLMPIIKNRRRKAIFVAAAALMVFHRPVSFSEVTEDHHVASIMPVAELQQLVDPQIFAGLKDIEVKPAGVKKLISHSSQATTPQATPAANVKEGIDPRASELDKFVHPITTVTEFIGGQEERNRGSGFVVGNQFFTVQHNLTTSFPSLRVKSTSFIDGMSVTKPLFMDVEQDVAVFELPERLCVKHCNMKEVDYTPNLSKQRKVYWLRKFQEEFILKEAKIVNAVTFGDLHKPADLTCGSQSVILVDQPFVPGSSGSPLMDAETDKIIGVIQGSVDENGISRGYFKPIHCVLAMLAEAEKSRSIAKL